MLPNHERQMSPQGFKGFEMPRKSIFDKTLAHLNGTGPKPTRRELMALKRRYERMREAGIELSPYMVSLLRMEGLI